MSRDDELQDRLRRLARAVPQEAGAATERELCAKFRARHRRNSRLWIYVAELAATLVTMVGLYLAVAHGRRIQERSLVTAPAAHVSTFVALPYAQSDVPMEQPVIVRVNISVSELGAMGMQVASAPKNGRVHADLLVGQDGVARAVRLVE